MSCEKIGVCGVACEKVHPTCVRGVHGAVAVRQATETRACAGAGAVRRVCVVQYVRVREPRTRARGVRVARKVIKDGGEARECVVRSACAQPSSVCAARSVCVLQCA